MNAITIQFTDNAAQEVSAIVHELQLLPIAEHLKSDSNLPDGLKASLMKLLSTVTDLFSTTLPDLETNPEQTLRIVSRDINLAKILRERGLFRLFRLISQTIPVDQDGNPCLESDAVTSVPLYRIAENPDTGERFKRQEEFIGWFCEQAHVARSLVFMRIRTIERAMTLGFTLPEVFELVLSKPYAIQETLHQLGESGVVSWEQGEIASVDAAKAIQVAQRVAPGSVQQIQDASDSGDTDELTTAIKPVLAELLNEVASHERSKDAMNYVKHDILLQPEISYEWDRQLNTLVVHLYKKEIDPQTKIELTGERISVPFVPDTMNLPIEIVEDLLKRLPIRNRYEL